MVHAYVSDSCRGHTHHTCIVAIYDLRRSHIVGMQPSRTEIENNLRFICRYPYHFSKQQQPIRIKWEETSYIYV